MLALVIASMSANVFAQDEHGHAGDIEFGYDSLTNPTGFDIEVGEVTSDGIPLFEGSFEELDPTGAPGDFSADEPGFTTNEAEGLLVTEGDFIYVNVLDASAHSLFGVGYVNFYNPTSGMLEPSGRLSIVDNTDTGTDDLVLNGASIESGDNPQFLGVSTPELGETVPEVHDHVIIDLLDDASALPGAYGILLELESDNPLVTNSEPFWIILNHEMLEDDFENFAVPAFAGTSAVPEPGAFSLLAMGAPSMLLRRRRR